MTPLDTVLGAPNAAALFSQPGKDPEAVYRRLRKLVHPDTFGGPEKDKARANDAFARLNELWNIHKHGKPSGGIPSNTVRTRRREYAVGDVLNVDEILTRYRATHDDGHKHCELLIANSTRDSDLISAYTSALSTLQNVPEQYRIYFPKQMERFGYRQSDGTHAGVALEALDGFYTLTQVLEDYPQGISGRDVAWMFRRMLVALGNAHDVGIVHGAPTLDAFRILPAQHGVVLDNWQYSVKIGAPLVAVPAKHKKDYPAYALAKEPVTNKLDITIAAKAAERLLGEKEPARIRRFLKASQLYAPPTAAELLAEFDEILLEIYGKHSFHVFMMKRDQK